MKPVHGVTDAAVPKKRMQVIASAFAFAIARVSFFFTECRDEDKDDAYRSQ